MMKKLVQTGKKQGYRQIADVIIGDIAKRKLVPGEKLLPQRELAHQLGVAIATVTRAYNHLEQQGFVSSHVGRGTFISGKRQDHSLTDMPRTDVIDLATYKVPVPDLDTKLAETFKAIIADHHPQQILGPSPTAGHLNHRRAIADWLVRYGVNVDPAQVIITNGGQHATMAALSTITHAGETIATEELSDPRMKAVASHLDRRLVGIKMDELGLIPESLDELCHREKIAAIYCTTRLQNPTNTTLPIERRYAVADIARRHDIPIIESDIYGTIFDDPEEPIVALAPERTHFISSFGRIAGPGMKVGCLVSPRSEVVRTQAGVGMSTGAATLIAVELTSRWINSGQLDGMIRWQQADNIRRISLLSTYPLLGTARINSASPHVWLPLPMHWRADNLIESAIDHGVEIAPTHSFVIGRNSLPHAVRLSVGAPLSAEVLQIACTRLERLLETHPKSNFK